MLVPLVGGAVSRSEELVQIRPKINVSIERRVNIELHSILFDRTENKQDQIELTSSRVE